MDPLEAHLRHQIARSSGFFWHRIRWRAVSEYLPRGRPFTLVDVGAGAGLLGGYLRKDFPNATYRFVERIPTLQRHLEAVYGREANAQGDPSFDDADVVTLLDVLEHQEDDRAFLADLAVRMRPGARLLMTVPALRSLWSMWDVALGHQRRYRRTDLVWCFKGAGMVVDEISYLFPELIPAGWARRLLRPARPGAARADSEAEETEFPGLPRALNGLLYAVGLGSVRLRRWWPVGASLLAAARRT
jgi:SAM-dependent methyltransferase